MHGGTSALYCPGLTVRIHYIINARIGERRFLFLGEPVTFFVEKIEAIKCFHLLQDARNLLFYDDS